MKRCRQVGLAMVLLVAGCYTVPETGRSAFVLPFLHEAAQGSAAFAELKATAKISDDPALRAQAQRVGHRIAEAVGEDLPGASWEFVVFEAPQTVNAFALPGGKVGVYSGLLLLVDSDDELAIVLGHEIAHVTARHGAQRVSEGAVALAGGVLVGLETRKMDYHYALLAGYGVVAGGTVLAFSRAHESEADFIGIRYAAKAGYDPRAALTFWKKVAKAGQPGGLAGQLTALASAHPGGLRRMADLEKAMPGAVQLYEQHKR